MSLWLSLWHTVAGDVGRKFKPSQRVDFRHQAAAYTGSARRVIQRVPDTAQEPRLSLHATQTQRFQQQVRHYYIQLYVAEHTCDSIP